MCSHYQATADRDRFMRRFGVALPEAIIASGPSESLSGSSIAWKVPKNLLTLRIEM